MSNDLNLNVAGATANKDGMNAAKNSMISTGEDFKSTFEKLNASTAGSSTQVVEEFKLKVNEVNTGLTDMINMAASVVDGGILATHAADAQFAL